jgi:thymidylate synthase
MNLKVGWVELLQLLAGIHDPRAYDVYAPKSRKQLFTPEMAYGPRTRAFWYRAVDQLRQNPDNRAVVVPVGDLQEEMGSVDDRTLPCTLGLQFLVRWERVHCVAHMRSLDCILGLPYDVVMFGGVTRAVAACLKLQPGTVVIQAGSCHVYQADAVEPGRLPRVPGRQRRFWHTRESEMTRWEDWRVWAYTQCAWRWEHRPAYLEV